ncbi:MAG: YdeI/OmpD-associated family protein [Acidobacteriota bacterium]|nr:YdeI/OmpD-associated family protein [Acidobacteriota bacterium]
MRGDLPILLFPKQSDWAAWLEQHHRSSPGVWLRLAKKGSTLKSVTYDEAVETGLCYGWIDGQKNRHNEDSWIQRFTPRGKTSIWSKVNREKALALIKDGRMSPAGFEAIELAKNNGRWDAAYESSASATVPADLQSALDRNARAKAFFATLNKLNRYAVLFRIQTARTPAAREKRIAEFVEMLARNEKLYP